LEGVGKMAKIPVALQLYSVREDCARDLPGTLEAVTEIGYDGVEFAGYHGRSAEELRGMLDNLGLRVAGTHVGIHTLLGEELQRSIEFNRAMGNRFLIVPSLPEEMRVSKASWLEAAHQLNEIATGNAMMGGVSPSEVLGILRRYPGRATTVHLKAFSPVNERALIGEGDMRWREFFSLCETVGGTEWYIVEQERYPYKPLECARICKENLDEIMR